MVFSDTPKVRPWRVIASAIIIFVLLWIAARIGNAAEVAPVASVDQNRSAPERFRHGDATSALITQTLSTFVFVEPLL
jgi:hypothetical protein